MDTERRRRQVRVEAVHVPQLAPRSCETRCQSVFPAYGLLERKLWNCSTMVSRSRSYTPTPTERPTSEMNFGAPQLVPLSVDTT